MSQPSPDAPVDQPVVHPARASLPELHRLGRGPGSRPTPPAPVPSPPSNRRRRRRTPPRARRGRPRAGTGARPRRRAGTPRGRTAKYSSTASRGQRRRDPVDADLALERVPGEQQRAPWVGGEVRALARPGVGVEDEPVGRDALEQHQPRGRARSPAPTVATTIALGSWMPAACASSYHRANIANGSGSEVGLVETAAGVLVASGGERVGQLIGQPLGSASATRTATVRHNSPHGR